MQHVPNMSDHRILPIFFFKYMKCMKHLARLVFQETHSGKYHPGPNSSFYRLWEMSPREVSMTFSRFCRMVVRLGFKLVRGQCLGHYIMSLLGELEVSCISSYTRDPGLMLPLPGRRLVHNIRKVGWSSLWNMLPGPSGSWFITSRGSRWRGGSLLTLFM